MAQSIRKTINKILDSKEYTEGSREDHERILIELCFVVFDSTRIKMAREYGRSRWLTTVHIKANLNNVEPPDLNFDIH